MATPKQIQQQCLTGKLDVPAATAAIDVCVGGIQRVIYKENKTFTIEGSDKRYSLASGGIGNKARPLLHGLAVLCYAQAQANSQLFPGEVHISKHASTKHHRKGIDNIIDKYK